MTPFLQPFSQLNGYPFSTPDHQEPKQPNAQSAPTASPLSATTSSPSLTPLPQPRPASRRRRKDRMHPFSLRRSDSAVARTGSHPVLPAPSGGVLSAQKKHFIKKTKCFRGSTFLQAPNGSSKHLTRAVRPRLPTVLRSTSQNFRLLHQGSFRMHFKNLLVRLLSPADSRSLETGADFLLFPFSAFFLFFIVYATSPNLSRF